MKKRNILAGMVLALGLTSCFDLDKMPEGVLSTTNAFASVGEMRNYLDQFYQDGLRTQGFDAGRGHAQRQHVFQLGEHPAGR